MKTYYRLITLCLLITLGFFQHSTAQQLPVVQFEFGDRQFEQNVFANAQAESVLSGPSVNSMAYRWVQFDAIPSDDERKDLESRGIQIIEYVPQYCYLMSIPTETDIDYLYQKGVRSIQPLDRPTKVDTRIMDENIPEYAQDGKGIDLKVLVMPGISIDGHFDNIEALGAYNIERPNHDRFIFLSLDRDNALRLADQPWVRYVELMDPIGEPESVEGRGLQRGNMLDNHLTGAYGKSYDGEGIKVLVRDDGDVGPHIDYKGRLWNDPNNGGGGTHGDGVAGVWAAAGNLDPTVIASASCADVYVIDYLSTFLDNTLDLHQDSGIVITNSSYSNGCNAGYTTTTVTVDEMAHDNPTLLHVFSAGNSNNNDCGYGAGNQWGNVTGGHKQGKNVIAVANLFRDGELVGSSSRGPAHDGRIKPDLAGHGQGQISTDPNNGYSPFGGTSAAAPSTAGNLTQLYHAYEDINGTTAPAALIKACALNSAQDYGNVGPDYKFGWGTIHAERAYRILDSNHYSVHTISNGGSNSHNISVPSGVGQVRFMIYWNDPEASPSADPALVNDLDMTVDDPSSNNYLPYLLDPTPNPVTLDLPAGNGVDHLNNVEQVAISTPSAGTYTVNVDGFAIPQGPQEYFLVWSFIHPGVTVTYPFGGEKLVPGVEERIHWDAFEDSGTFDVEYSTNNGGSWLNIASNVAADERGVDWTPPSVTSGNCLVRVTRGAEFGESDEPFSIHQVPTGLSLVEGPGSSVDVSWNAVSGATSYNIYLLGAKKMELHGTSATNSYNAAGVPMGERLWFSVSANTGAAEGQRSIATDIINGDACPFNVPAVTIPFAEGFESGQGDFCNSINDDIDWDRQTGGTTSNGTGPDGAFEGSFYMYIEASNPNFPTMTANLVSPPTDLAGCSNATLLFRYHMLGLEMGTLNVQVSTDNGDTWLAPIFTVSGDQGNVWNQATVDLSTYCGQTILYRFNGTTGTNFTSDIAIDDILIDDGLVCLAPNNFTTGAVTGDEATLLWDDVAADSYELELVDLSNGGSFTGTPTVTGVTGDQYTFTGLLEGNQYEAYIRKRCSGDSSAWRGPETFTTIGCISVIPWTDDFNSYATCATTSGPQICDFGGGWTQDPGDGNDWRVNNGGTPSDFTGPDGDNPNDLGNYLYIEASQTFNLVSNVISPCFDLDVIGDAELSFFYHMFGDDMGTLNVDISNDGGATWNNLWSQTGEVQGAHSDAWIEVVIDLFGYTGPSQFRFQGIAGPNFESDMAIDDVSLVPNSECPVKSSVSIANILETSATVNWTNNPVNDGTEIEFVDLTGGDIFTGVPTFTGLTGTSYMLTGLTQANDYAVYIRGTCGTGFSSWTGPFNFTTDCSNYPGNLFASAIEVNSLPYIDMNRTDLSCLTNEYTGQASNDIIYELVAQTDSLYISTCTGQTLFDTYIYLLDSAQNIVAFNDDADPACIFTLNGNNRFSTIATTVSPNSTYYIVVEGFQTNSGDYALEINDGQACPTTLSINGIPGSGVYSASTLITSSGLIENPNNVIFNSGGEVDLLPDFEVELGAQFETDDGGCN